MLASAGLIYIIEFDNWAKVYKYNNYGTCLYYVWSVFHKVPYGDIITFSAGGKIITSIICLLGNLYQPYLLALVALRRPTLE